MASEVLALIFIPLFIFGSLQFIFQESLALSAETYFDQINCEEPSFNQAYNSTTHPDNPCASAIDQDTPYDQQELVLWSVGLNFFGENTTNTWTASIPTGWFTYVWESVTVKVAKAGAIVNLLAVPFTLPTEINDTDLPFLRYINIGLFVMVGIGIYIAVNPFK